MRRSLWILFALLAAAGCDSGGVCDDGCPGGGDEVVAGVNLTRLFDAPLTAAERDAVAADAAARDAAATATDTRPVLEEAGRGTDASGAEVVVYAAFPRDTTAGRDTLFVAAVRRPLRAPGDVRQRPLWLVLPEGPVDAASLPGQTPLGDALTDEVVMATVALRGTPLRLGGRSWGAGVAPGAAYVTDVDDVRTAMTALPALEPLVDASRAGATGLGRGGTTALALAVRRPPALRLVVSLSAPTSFVLPDVRRDARAWLTGGITSRIPALDEVFAATVGAVRDGTATPAEARLGLLLRSPGAFAVPPPRMLAVHGVLDLEVPVSQLGGLAGFVDQPDAAVLRLEEGDHTSVVRDGEVLSTVSALARLALGLP